MPIRSLDLVAQDEQVSKWVAPDDLQKLFAVEGYTGIAEPRAREIAQKVRACIEPDADSDQGKSK